MAETGRKREQLRTIGELLGEAMRSVGLTDQARRFDISRIWNRAVGERIASNTSPHSFSRGTLIVKATSAAWQNELTFLKTQILTKLNRAMGSNMVTDLRVLAGHGRIAPKKPERKEQKPVPSPADLAAAAEAAAPIKDSQIQESFIRAMALDRQLNRK